jgi:hypothetical protein
MNPLPMTEQLRLLQERNLARVQELKEKMGKQWLLHPANTVTRKSSIDKSKANLNMEYSL